MFALLSVLNSWLTFCAITKSHQGLNDATHLPTANISVQKEALVTCIYAPLFDQQCVRATHELTYRQCGVEAWVHFICVHVFCINEPGHKRAAWTDSVDGLASGRLWPLTSLCHFSPLQDELCHTDAHDITCPPPHTHILPSLRLKP